jgi:hypothetical protein
MGAAHAYPGDNRGGALSFGRDKGGGYGALWRRVKPAGMPDEVCFPHSRTDNISLMGIRQGIPFDTSDPMFNPPTETRGGRNSLTPSPTPGSLPHPASLVPQRPSGKHHKSSHSTQRIIPQDEDVKRLFEECVLAKQHAGLLNEALAFASPEDLLTNKLLNVRCF